MTQEITQVYTTPDGQTFDTKAEAQDYLRRPKQKEAFDKITDNNEELTTWLLDNKDTVDAAFEVGTIRRVTKSDKKKLLAALEAAKKLFDEGVDNHLQFLADNVDDIYEGFRYPPQKRLTEEERAVAAKNTLMAETENEELSDWVIANQEAIAECYSAGKEKRVVNEKAALGLATYRVRRAEEKLEKLKAELATAKKGGNADEISEAEEAVVEASGKLEDAKSNLESLK